MTFLTRFPRFRVSLGGNASGALLMVAGMVTLQTGSALATHLFGAVGPSGTAWLRMSWAAVFLVAVTARRLGRELRSATRRDIASAALLGAVSAGMTLCYSEAVARIPMGTATAIEFTGPLLVAVVAMRRAQEMLWLALAAVGLTCLTQPWSGAQDVTGLLFAAGAAACWAVFVLATQAVGERFSGLNGLALAMVAAALVSAPFGAPGVAGNPDPWVIAASAGIAVLMPLMPYAFEMEALRRLTRTVYGTVAGLEPAVAALIGMVVLAQLPGLAQAGGIVLIVTAGIGAARSGSRREREASGRVVRTSEDGHPPVPSGAPDGDGADPRAAERAVGSASAAGRTAGGGEAGHRAAGGTDLPPGPETTAPVSAPTVETQPSETAPGVPRPRPAPDHGGRATAGGGAAPPGGGAEPGAVPAAASECAGTGAPGHR